MKHAKFFIGQIVYHKLFNYRGVIFDVDFEFLGGEEWYDKVAKSRPSKYQPWYHVLVDNAKHQTYVAESNLSVSDNSNPINNPFLENYFSGLKNGVYQLNLPKN